MTLAECVRDGRGQDRRADGLRLQHRRDARGRAAGRWRWAWPGSAAHVGLAFQLTDDLLGIWGAPEVTGKPVRADLRARKKSLPGGGRADQRHASGGRAQARCWPAPDDAVRGRPGPRAPAWSSRPAARPGPRTRPTTALAAAERAWPTSACPPACAPSSPPSPSSSRPASGEQGRADQGRADQPGSQMRDDAMTHDRGQRSQWRRCCQRPREGRRGHAGPRPAITCSACRTRGLVAGRARDQRDHGRRGPAAPRSSSACATTEQTDADRRAGSGPSSARTAPGPTSTAVPATCPPPSRPTSRSGWPATTATPRT